MIRKYKFKKKRNCSNSTNGKNVMKLYFCEWKKLEVVAFASGSPEEIDLPDFEFYLVEISPRKPVQLLSIWHEVLEENTISGMPNTNS